MAETIVRTTDDLRCALEACPDATDRRLGEILVGERWLTRQQLQQALKSQARDQGRHLGRILIEAGVVTTQQVTVALAQKFGIPVVKLEHLDVDARLAQRIPVELAVQHNLLPLAEIAGRLVIATDNPLDQARMEVIRFHCKEAVTPVLASAEEIALGLTKYYSHLDEHEALRGVSSGEASAVERTPATRDMEREASRRPIVRLLDAIVSQAVMRGASDIHLRPESDLLTIFYRIDGRLQRIRDLHRSLVAPLVSRIKILAHMNIAEHRLPQEGAARIRRDGRSVDLRVSVMPTLNGESVVIRILDRTTGLKSLDSLGLSRVDCGRIRRMLSRPHGLFLVTGPTGSGKSTSLYALLNEIRRCDGHILTVEDPIEYDMEGIEQVQIFDRIGVTFAGVLRHFLRHDPDVIMVGEIRDAETANVANKAALTGHLVLSSAHTNDAPGAVTRLLDMGVEPYLLASTLLGIMAQRLVRLNCRHCVTIDESGTELLQRGATGVTVSPSIRAYRGAGCHSCHQTGYAGRGLVSEILTVTPEIANKIATASHSRDELARCAETQGMTRLAESAIHLVLKGKTSVEEMLALGVGAGAELAVPVESKLVRPRGSVNDL